MPNTLGTLFDVKGSIKTLELKIMDFRVPRRRELYINKDGLLQRCLQDNYSRHAKKRIIVKEDFNATELK